MERDPRAAFDRFHPFVRADRNAIDSYIAQLSDLRSGLDGEGMSDAIADLDRLIEQRIILSEQLNALDEVILSEVGQKVSVAPTPDSPSQGRRLAVVLRPVFASIEALEAGARHVLNEVQSRLLNTAGRIGQSSLRIVELASVITSKLRQLAADLIQLISQLPLPTMVEGMTFTVGVGFVQLGINLIY